jgi:hypothetical protein
MAQPAMILVMIISVEIHSLLTSITDQMELPEASSWAAPAKAGDTNRPSSFHHSANHTCRASPPDKLGRTPVRASPLALGLIVPLAKLGETPIRTGTLAFAIWGNLIHSDQARLCLKTLYSILYILFLFKLALQEKK